MKTEKANKVVAGKQIQFDRSGGQGHCWVNVAADEIPASVREEIEGEVIDGKMDSCSDFVATGGQHYRW
jgi:hypothetical protein